MSIDVADMNSKTTDVQARQKGEAFAKQFAAAITALRIEPAIQRWDSVSNVGLLTLGAYDVVTRRLSLPSPRNAFIFALGSAFGEVQAVAPWVADRDEPADPDFDFPVEKANDLLFLNWRSVPSLQRDWVWAPDGSILVPVSKTFVQRGGETHTYSFQAFNQRSDTRGGEQFMEVYVTQEIGAKVGLGALPGIGAIFSYDVKHGQKVGEKQSQKWEESKAIRVGRQISRSFVLEKIARNCLLITPDTPRQVGVALYAQYGWRITFREGGDPMGPYWDRIHANGSMDGEKVTYGVAAYNLRQTVDEAALEIAQRARETGLQ